MKLTTFFLLITFITVNASVYSQVTKLDLKVQSLTVKEVLIRIEDQSQFFFMYNDRKIDVERKVDFDLKQAKIEDLLNTIFEGTDTKFLIKDRQIVLYNESDEGFRVSNTESLTQQPKKTISGKVSDSSGATLPGVSVVVKGTTIGVITDNNGGYTLSNIPENATLQFSFVGMKLQEIAIGGKTSINVKLEEETIGIEEVVAIGYGVVKKSDLTGAVSSIGSKELSSVSTQRIDQALQGKAAGVQVTSVNGSPGAGTSIRIRGGNSISASNEPLYVIDGFIGGGDLNSINPEDIKSIEILKDASSTAIYGSRGANGVILITTKQGIAGKANITVNAYSGVQQLPKEVDLLTGPNLHNM